MKNVRELCEILDRQAFCRVDAHIHTHLCDGHESMTVQNIAQKAMERGMSLIILTPHFHRRVADQTASLYENTQESILIDLREEIERFYRKSRGNLTILLSAETDILNEAGEIAFPISKEAETAVDLITPTLNYHPLLPLKAVEVTYGRCIEEMHKSGLYGSFAEKAGGVEKVLESLYQTQANAILRSPYPAMLGHFFAAHSYAVGKYNWFGAKPEHLHLIREGAFRVAEACVKKGAMIDLTGIHCSSLSFEEKREADGFFFGFQQWFAGLCREKNIRIFPGTDSHHPDSVGNVLYYKLFERD